MQGTIIFMAVLCLLAGAADASRLLRQTTDSRTSKGVDKSSQTYSYTLNAEARSTPQLPAVSHVEATMASFASFQYPGPNTRVATENVNRNDGFTDVGAALFGTAAVAGTQGGAIAVSASEGMPLSKPAGTPGSARSVNYRAYDVTDLKGGGNSQNVMPFSIGTNRLPSTAFTNSAQGDGPTAQATAGEAVATSLAGKVETR